MSAWKPCLFALGAGVWLGVPAAAQGVVPGGWASEFSYQSFVGPGVAGFGVGAYPGHGYGTTLPGLTPYYSSGSLNASAPAAAPPVLGYRASAQTTNAVDPLIGAIRQSTRRKASR